MGRWMDVKAVLRVAYSNQKLQKITSVITFLTPFENFFGRLYENDTKNSKIRRESKQTSYLLVES